MRVVLGNKRCELRRRPVVGGKEDREGGRFGGKEWGYRVSEVSGIVNTMYVDLARGHFSALYASFT